MSFPLGICASSMPITIRPLQNEALPSSIAGGSGYAGMSFPLMYPDNFQVAFQIKNSGLSGNYDVLIGKTSPPTGSAGSQESSMPVSYLLGGKGSFFIKGAVYGVQNAPGAFYAAGTTIYYRLKLTINGVDSYTPIYSFVRA